ncbi:hypothetical protein TNCV_1145881 [Trichonephila clavipes]|nr:hypothetical protein TNCV_1145881 [Trichonephila clavipes]
MGFKAGTARKIAIHIQKELECKDSNLLENMQTQTSRILAQLTYVKCPTGNGRLSSHKHIHYSHSMLKYSSDIDLDYTFQLHMGCLIVYIPITWETDPPSNLRLKPYVIVHVT